MRAAIYARYSSENQRPESIDDQISSCNRFAEANGFKVLKDHIYTDHAISGSRKDRDGLNALITASENKDFEIVLIDDLSRLARDNFLMLSLISNLHFEGIRIVSVSDGLDSNDEESKLGIQIRGIFNELQLQDLKKKTLRGLIGQKLRGFSVGEKTFGYRSVPYGEFVIDKKGNPRPEGHKLEKEPRESAIVQRIFNSYNDGCSINRIAKMLNEEGILGRNNQKYKWCNSTISRILDNEKYIGKWVWNKTESRRDPSTGRRKRFPKPESEWITNIDDSLIIIPQQLWESVHERRAASSKAWPKQNGKNGFSKNQGKRGGIYPTHILSGMMTCASCGSTIGQTSGKGCGYFGCLGAKRGTCDNKILVRRKLAEDLILDEVNKQLSSPENFQLVLKKVEDEIRKLCSHVPDQIRVKEAVLAKEDRRLTNFIEFIAEGRKSTALSKALEETEKRVNTLQAELNGLRNARDKLFEAPPIEWIEAKLENTKALLEKNFTKSSEALRQLLGPMTLKAVYPDIGKPYFIAHSSINTTVLLENPPSGIDAEGGSTTLRWWTWSQRVRTVSKPTIEVHILDTLIQPLYQQVATQALQLREQSLSLRMTAIQLNVDEKTVSKAIQWLNEFDNWISY